MDAGFYSISNGQIQYAPNFVYGPDYTLLSEDKDTYTYPVNGWTWYADRASAEAGLLPADNPFYYAAGNYYIDTRIPAQLDFNGLVTLIQLKMNAGKIMPGSPIHFKDYFGMQRSLSAEDFISMIMDYGDYCITIFGIQPPGVQLQL